MENREILYGLITDEALRDGRLDSTEKELLTTLARFLRIEKARAIEIAKQSQERFKAGKLGASRAYSLAELYEKALRHMLIDGRIDEEEARTLEGLRKLFRVDEPQHRAIVARIQSERAPPATSAPPAPPPLPAPVRAVPPPAPPEEDPHAAAGSQPPRKIHYGFAHFVLRSHAFAKPGLVVKILREGNAAKFLGDVWADAEKTGRGMGDTTVYDRLPAGRGQLFGPLVGGLVTMPRPLAMTEVYFIALVTSESIHESKLGGMLGQGVRGLMRERGFPDMQYFTLEHSYQQDGRPCALLCSWDAHDNHQNYGEIVQPTEAAFVAAVETRVKRTIESMK